MLTNLADVILGPSIGSMLMFLVAAGLVVALVVGVIILIRMLRKPK